MSTINFKDFKMGEKIFFIGLIIWILLQMSRFIAFIVSIMVKQSRGLLTWAFVVVYLAISIVDHCGNFTTTSYVGAPSIVQEGSSPYTIPVIQTVIDGLFFVLMFVPGYRRLFFKTEGEL